MSSDAIANLLVENLSRDLVLTAEELLEAGAIRAFALAKGMDDGHLPSVVGTLRHFQMNQGFHAALLGNLANPTPIRGNSLIVGRSGLFQIGRFNINQGPWHNARRSKQRRVMAEANKAIEPLVMGDMFSEEAALPPATASVFFVGIFSPSVKQGERPISIEVAVPDKEMKGWLFHEPVEVFVRRYVKQPVQVDNALPTLKVKKGVGPTPHES